MAAYSFVTVWRLDAPSESVFDALIDSIAWPTWWPSVTSVEELEPGGVDGIDNLRRYTMRGRLPYALAFDMRTTAAARPTHLAGDASGELEGTGAWSLADGDDGWTTVRYEWNVRTTRRFMNLAAPLPFVRRIFELNHDAVMRSGLRGLAARLGCRGMNVRA